MRPEGDPNSAPDARYGEVPAELRGDLAALLHLPDGGGLQANNKTSDLRENGSSGVMMGLLDDLWSGPENLMSINA